MFAGDAGRQDTQGPPIEDGPRIDGNGTVGLPAAFRDAQSGGPGRIQGDSIRRRNLCCSRGVRGDGWRRRRLAPDGQHLRVQECYLPAPLHDQEDLVPHNAVVGHRKGATVLEEGHVGARRGSRKAEDRKGREDRKTR